MKRPISLDHLSQLQKLCLVMLLEERMCSLRCREFRRLVKALYWGRDVSAHVAAVSLSRALSRLEERGLIERFSHGGWQLTCPDSDFVRNGYMFALLAWRKGARLYVQVGLRGPDIKSWRTEAPERKGVEVELKL
jgi:hypothetical protein